MRTIIKTKSLMLFYLLLSISLPVYGCGDLRNWFYDAFNVTALLPLFIAIIIYVILKRIKKTRKKSLFLSSVAFVLVFIGSSLVLLYGGTGYGSSFF